MQMQGSFNANQYEPNQSGGSTHPPARKIPFTITGTAIKENKSKNGGFFEVELTSQLGTQIQRYNIWNNEPKAVEIAHGQLSALCRCVGRFQIDWSNEGAALRGSQGLMDIGYQKGEEPTAEKPNGGYTELKKVYDIAGNEPGKTNAPQPQPSQTTGLIQPQASQNAPMVQQAGGGWGNQPPSNQAAQGQPQSFQEPQQRQAWQPGGAQQASTQPPWGQR